MIDNIKTYVFTDDNQENLKDKFNSLYDFFIGSWDKTWKELNTNSVDYRDDFSRFKTKTGFYLDGQFVAFHGYGSFDLNKKCDAEHSYFRKLEIPLAEMLIEKKIFKVATLEYMSVAPDFRKISGQYLGEILGGFSTQYFRDKDYDAVVTIARNNRGVNKMCQMYGAYSLAENLQLHDVAVDVMIFEPNNVKNHPTKEIQDSIDFLADMIKEKEIFGVAA